MMRRLFWDIETSPNVGLFWKSGYKISVGPECIVKERAIITIAWKWEGKPVQALHWDNNQDDKSMLQKFIPILNSADESVAHFGDSFDLPWVKGRCLFHRIPTLPKYKTIDTCQWSSRHFLLNSNKLDYLAKYLGFGGKIKTGFDLWKKILLSKDSKALAYMVKYNKQDVILLEKVFGELSKFVPHKTHVGVMNGKEKWTCAKCGGKNVKTSKTRVTAAGTKQYQMQCNDCGTYYQISEPSHNDYIAHLESGL